MAFVSRLVRCVHNGSDWACRLEDFAKLVGVSGLTIYNWEHGKARPKKERLGAFFALRHVGKREALKKLEMLKGRPKRRAK